MKRYTLTTTVNFIRRNTFLNMASMTEEEKSKYILAVLLNVPLTNIILEESEFGYSILYGHKLLSSIKSFLDEGFKISSCEGFPSDLSGLSFKELDLDKRSNFLETGLVIDVCNNITEDDKNLIMAFYKKPVKKEVFKDMLPSCFCKLSENESLPSELQKAEKQEDAGIITKVSDIAPSVSNIDVDCEIKRLLGKFFFSNTNIKLPLTNDVLLSILMVSEDGVTQDLSSKNISSFEKELIASPEKFAVAKIESIIDYLGEAYFESTEYLKKIHLPMICVCAKKAFENNVPPLKFKETIDSFFESNDLDYKKASADGTSSKSQVNKRLMIMTKYFNKNI